MNREPRTLVILNMNCSKWMMVCDIDMVGVSKGKRGRRRGEPRLPHARSDTKVAREILLLLWEGDRDGRGRVEGQRQGKGGVRRGEEGG